MPGQQLRSGTCFSPRSQEAEACRFQIPAQSDPQSQFQHSQGYTKKPREKEKESQEDTELEKQWQMEEIKENKGTAKRITKLETESW